MKLLWRWLLLWGLVAICSGCATVPPRQALGEFDEDQKAKVVVVLLEQHEIEVDKPNVSNGAGASAGAIGALIGALVEVIAESSMDKRRQAALQPIRTGLNDVDFEQEFLDTLKHALPHEIVAIDANVQVARSIEEYRRLLAQAKPNQGLGMVVRYAYQENFRGVYMTLGVHLGLFYAQGEKTPRDAPKGVGTQYASEYINPSAYQGRGEHDYDVNAPYWASDQGAPTRAAIRQAISELLRLLNTDFVTPMPEGATSVRFLTLTVPGGLAIKGSVVAEEGRRLLVKTKYGSLHWIDQAQRK